MTDAAARRQTWRLAAILLVVGVLAVLLLLTPVRTPSRAADAIMDLAHAPFFGGIAFYLLLSFQRIAPRPPLSRDSVGRSALVVLVLTAMGILAEWLQQYFGRSTTLHDAVANSLGVLSAVTIFLAWQIQRQGRSFKWTWRIMMLAGGFLLALACYRPLMTLRDVYIMRSGFPMLASFESSSELDRFYTRGATAKLSRSYVSDGRYSMELLMRPLPTSFAMMVRMQRDWSALETLEMDVTLDGAHDAGPVKFRLQLKDEAPDESNTTVRRDWILQPGRRQHLQLSRQEILNQAFPREIDLTRIRFVEFRLVNLTEPTRIYIDAVKLTLQQTQ